MSEELPDSNPKSQFGIVKPQLDKIPPTALIELAVVMGLGARKYGPFNWRENSVAASIYIAAAQRHILSWFDGENTDRESGANHLAHAMACLAIVVDAKEVGNLIDDRPPKGMTAQMITRCTYAETPPPKAAPITPAEKADFTKIDNNMFNQNAINNL